MKKVITILAGLVIGMAAQGGEVNFPRAGVTLTTPDGWLYTEEGNKAFALNPDKSGKIQAFVTSLPKGDLNGAVQSYYDSTFKGQPSQRPGQSVALLEKGDFETADGIKGVKGAFGYEQGVNGGPEVWTWRYFFQRGDGVIVSVCSYVYGDAERAKVQETIIAESLHLVR